MANKIETYAKKIGKSVVSVTRKVFGGISLFLTFLFAGLSALFFVVDFPVVHNIIGLGIFFAFIGAGFLVLSILLFKGSGNLEGKAHHADVKTCKELLKKIRIYLKSENINIEFSDTYIRLKEQLENSKILAKRIDNILKITKSKDWDTEEIINRISYESKKTEVDRDLIKKLTEQKENIIKIKEKENNLRKQLSNLKTNFNSIYTKLTVLDTTNQVDVDKIEEEIQKTLDFKLKVSKYEEELKKDFE
ncbi:MAG: hypothetical protein A2086_11895 [Spirochaetes bacterium GWD1_27_9]|nr:MAG: hypothetical protein A2Z98_11485 [Spirochaetes bacterium GWB1_27_13]OHD27464.1 MAG: hypothetical protein A2Y34_16210 [Spirochaetes bacterium GWC1_27_15]OHD28660.1 MAG: hypothetical protein A2086_11895 [Spirochaetes bacterium GWD1_27_9]